MVQSTEVAVVLCEKHAAVIGRHVAAVAQDDRVTLDAAMVLEYVGTVLEGLRLGRLGACSADFCYSPGRAS